jgi:hypothetical protein
MSDTNENIVVDAINDLTRVTLALYGNGASKSEMIRRLNSMSMSPSRIAALLSMAPKDVTSLVSKLRKGNKGVRKAKARE